MSYLPQAALIIIFTTAHALITQRNVHAQYDFCDVHKLVEVDEIQSRGISIGGEMNVSGSCQSGLAAVRFPNLPNLIWNRGSGIRFSRIPEPEPLSRFRFK